MTPERKFQIKYLIMVLLVVLFTTIIIGGGIYYSILSEVIYRLPDVSENTLTKSVVFSEVNSTLFILLPVLFIIVAAVSLLLFGRIAAPLAKLKKEIEALKRGDFTLETDEKSAQELTDLVKSLHEAKKSISEIVFEQRKEANKLLEAADQLLKECADSKHEKKTTAELINKLKSTIDSLQISLSKFRINK